MKRNENYMRVVLLALFSMHVMAAGCGDTSMIKNSEMIKEHISVYSVEKDSLIRTERVIKSEDEWKKILNPESFSVARKKGTERPFSGALNYNKERGVYRCVCCGNDLFLSETKFDSGTGWPSFYAPVHEKNIRLEEDRSIFMVRVEVLCALCDAHLGHVFDDGPPPTGRRYCMNSASMEFHPVDADSSRQKPGE